MNKLIVVGSSKGGTGKTTLVTHLAALHEHKNGKVALVDVDPSGASSIWHSLRKTPNIELYTFKSNADIKEELAEIKRKHPNRLIVVDCGGFDSRAMRTAIMADVTDAVIIPSKTSEIDLAVARPFIIQTVAALKDKKTLRGCVMDADPLPSLASEILFAKDAMTKFGLKPLNSFTYRRKAYKDNFLKGGDALRSNAKAFNDVEQIYNEISKL